MTYSVVAAMFQPLFHSVLRLVGADVRSSSVIGLVAGRVYWSANIGMAAARPFVSPSKAAGVNTMFGGEHMRQFERGEFDLCDEDLPDLGFTWPRYILSWPGILRSLIAHRPSRAAKFMADLQARNDAITEFDLAAATTEELTRMLRQSLQESLKDCDLLYFWWDCVAVGVFTKACRDWLGGGEQGLGYRLQAAQGGITDTEAGLELWRLAALAHEDKETQAALLGEDAWDAIRPRLARTDHGRRFLAAWDRFLVAHGQHCHNELELFSPRWAETPDYILGLVRGYLRSIGRADPPEKQRQRVEERERLTRWCRQKLRNPIKRRLFNWSLRGTQQTGSRQRELEERGGPAPGRLSASISGTGRASAADKGSSPTATTSSSWRWRRSSRWCWAGPISTSSSVSPSAGPSTNGTRPRLRRRWSSADTIRRKHVASKIDANVKVLQGIAVSPGIATGKARVITQPDDGQHVEPGEILVAPVTNPAWTPYFLPAAGVVMDMGGVLSHGAIIAREYGLPAVVNVGPASKIIRTGQTICVDGDRGTVTILDDELRKTEN